MRFWKGAPDSGDFPLLLWREQWAWITASGEAKEHSHQIWFEQRGHHLEIIEKAPGDWEVEYRYGVCLAELGNLREARTHVER